MQTANDSKAAGTKMVAFRCPVSLWEQIKITATRERTSLQDICIRALTAFIERKGHSISPRTHKRSN